MVHLVHDYGVLSEMSLTVTVSQVSGSKTGMILRALVLNNVAGGISGLVGGQTGVGAHRQNSQTAFDAFSEIYGIIFNGDTDGSSMSGLLGGQTQVDSVVLLNGQMLTFKIAVPNPPVSTNYGSAASFNGGFAFAEILAATSAGVSQDGSTPVVADNNLSTIAQTFTPPNGSLILIMAACPGTAGLSITDTAGLTWTLLTTSASSNSGRQSIWAAFAPTTLISSSDTATGTDAGEALHATTQDADSALWQNSGETVVQTTPPRGPDAATSAEVGRIAVASNDAGGVNASTGEAGSVFIGIVQFITSADASQKPTAGATGLANDRDVSQSGESQAVRVLITATDTGHGTDGH